MDVAGHLYGTAVGERRPLRRSGLLSLRFSDRRGTGRERPNPEPGRSSLRGVNRVRPNPQPGRRDLRGVNRIRPNPEPCRRDLRGLDSVRPNPEPGRRDLRGLDSVRPNPEPGRRDLRGRRLRGFLGIGPNPQALRCRCGSGGPQAEEHGKSGEEGAEPGNQARSTASLRVLVLHDEIPPGRSGQQQFQVPKTAVRQCVDSITNPRT